MASLHVSMMLHGARVRARLSDSNLVMVSKSSINSVMRLTLLSAFSKNRRTNSSSLRSDSISVRMNPWMLKRGVFNSWARLPMNSLRKESFAFSDLMSAIWLLAQVRMSSRDCCSSRTSSALDPWEMASDRSLTRRWRSFSTDHSMISVLAVSVSSAARMANAQRCMASKARNSKRVATPANAASSGDVFFASSRGVESGLTCQIYTRHPLPW